MRFTRLVAFAALTAASSSSIAGAQMGTMTPLKPVTLGISAGAAIPTADLSNGVNTGYTVAGHIGLNFPMSPIALRGDVGYTSFGAKGTSSGNNLHDWNATANALYNIAGGSSVAPYLLGGVGAYKFSATTTGAGYSTTYNDRTRLGFQLGGGLNIPLGTLNTFVEAKYVRVNGDNGASGSSYVPITFGLMF